MRISAADSKGTYTGSSREGFIPAILYHLPLLSLLHQIEGAALVVYVWINFLKINGSWQGFVLHGQQYLDHTGNASGRFQVPDLGFY